MKRNLMTMALFAALTLLAACSPSGNFMDGPAMLPVDQNGVTDVGNPNDEAELPKGTYVNEEFRVRISYPGYMDLDERGSEEAIFSSDKDESVSANFVRLSQGQGLDSFLEETRGGSEDLVSQPAQGFERILCNPAAVEVDEDGMQGMECYFYGLDEANGPFVVVMTGVFMEGNGFLVSMTTLVWYGDMAWRPEIAQPTVPGPYPKANSGRRGLRRMHKVEREE